MSHPSYPEQIESTANCCFPPPPNDNDKGVRIKFSRASIVIKSDMISNVGVFQNYMGGGFYRRRRRWKAKTRCGLQNVCNN